MLITIADTNAHQFQKAFPCDTRIVIQVKGAGTIFLGRDQGEVQNPNDGLQFNQASTSPPAQPYDMIWQGELWYRGDTPGQSFTIIIIGKVGDQARGAGARGI